MHQGWCSSDRILQRWHNLPRDWAPRCFIGAGVEFERLHAPRISFALAPKGVADRPEPVLPVEVTPVQAQPLADGCFCVDGDLDAPPHSLIRGDFVVRGSVRIGSNSVVQGSIKSHHDMRIEPDTSVEGSLISAR